MENTQKASGMTLWPARSDAIHCTTKRAVNRSCAATPSAIHQSSRVTNTSVKYAPTACDRSMSKGYLLRVRNAFFAPNEPPHAGEIEDADAKAIPKAVIGHALAARPVDHVDIADGKTVAADERRQKAMQAVEIGQRQKHLARKGFESTAGIARAV